MKLAAALLLLALQAPPCPAAAPPGAASGPDLEARVKTAFIYKFSRYVLWSEGEAGGEFTIGVLGRTALLPHLRELAGEKTPDGRRIALKTLKLPGEIAGCRIVFIAGSESDLLPEILARAELAGALAVADTPGFAARGSAINFVIKDGRVRFEINRAAAGRARLELSSELLKLAILVEDRAAGGKVGEEDGDAENRRAAP